MPEKLVLEGEILLFSSKSGWYYAFWKDKHSVYMTYEEGAGKGQTASRAVSNLMSGFYVYDYPHPQADE